MNSSPLHLILGKAWSTTCRRFLHCTGALCINHYDTLKLPKDCTTKEIKEAFIKLSKEHHPDVNSNSKSHTEFQKIQEAYSILSKPHLRHLYDIDIGIIKGPSGRSIRHVYSSADPFVNNPWGDPSFYENRDKSQDPFNAQRPYYGIRGVKKQPNAVIAFLCIAFTGMAFAIQMVFIKYAYGAKEEFIIQKSMEAEEALKEVRERAIANGNQIQMEILRQHFDQMQKSDSS